jgi:hypothetical protein
LSFTIVSSQSTISGNPGADGVSENKHKRLHKLDKGHRKCLYLVASQFALFIKYQQGDQSKDEEPVAHSTYKKKLKQLTKWLSENLTTEAALEI